jgi:tRNA A-37 threonylcarbamoyl transferase component Bud32
MTALTQELDMPASKEAVNLEQLRAAGAGVTTPFRLELPGEALYCHEVLRLLPGRRVVLRAEWSGKPVLAKLFLGRKATRDTERERSGAALLQQAGVATPALLADVSLPPAGRVLLFEFLQDAVSLLPGNSGVDVAALRQACVLLARLHAHGLRHTDLHLNNFLLAHEQVYAVDAGAVRAARAFWRTQASGLVVASSRRDLANLLAQLPLSWDRTFPDLWAAYAAARGWPEQSPLERAWRRRVAQARRQRIDRYQRKSLRDCTEFAAAKRFTELRSLRRCYDGPQLQQVLAQPDVALRQGRLLKAGNTATLAEIEADGRRYVIKRYNIKSLRHWLSRCWRPSRALRSWRNALQLEMLGIATATPVALLERRQGPLRGRAFLLTESLSGPDLLQAVQGPRYSGTEKSIFLQQATTLLQQLAAAGLVHGDTKATNFLLDVDGLKLIDLDSMHWPRLPWRQRRGSRRDQARFLRNWLDQDSTAAEVGRALNIDRL